MATQAPSVREYAFAAKRTDCDERAPPTEEDIATFGRWYESQPEEWVEFLDDLGKNGSSKHRAR